MHLGALGALATRTYRSDLVVHRLTRAQALTSLLLALLPPSRPACAARAAVAATCACSIPGTGVPTLSARGSAGIAAGVCKPWDRCEVRPSAESRVWLRRLRAAPQVHWPGGHVSSFHVASARVSAPGQLPSPSEQAGPGAASVVLAAPACGGHSGSGSITVAAPRNGSTIIFA